MPDKLQSSDKQQAMELTTDFLGEDRHEFVAPASRHSAIMFCPRTQGRCNQHGMGEGILG